MGWIPDFAPWFSSRVDSSQASASEPKTAVKYSLQGAKKDGPGFEPGRRARGGAAWRFVFPAVLCSRLLRPLQVIKDALQMEDAAAFEVVWIAQ